MSLMENDDKSWNLFRKDYEVDKKLVWGFFFYSVSRLLWEVLLLLPDG